MSTIDLFPGRIIQDMFIKKKKKPLTQ
jgi:hypothetical protein